MNKRQQLIHFFSELPEPQQAMLVDFAEFLHARHAQLPVLELNPLPRPAQESVIAAIKRLSKTYPMLTKTEMFNETSALMTAHVMHGEAADKVIDGLESMFAQHYQRFLDGQKHNMAADKTA